MKLYTSALSANGRKVLAAVRALELDVEIVDVNVYAGEGQTLEYQKIHPRGQVPALVVGEFELWESNAILLYLSDLEGGRLNLGDPIGRADVARWLFWESATWQPAVAALLARPVAHLLDPGQVPAPTELVNWEEPAFAEALRLLDHRLGQGPWISGDMLTVADLALAGMTMYLPSCGFDLDRTPGLGAWMHRLSQEPAWASTRVDPWIW